MTTTLVAVDQFFWTEGNCLYINHTTDMYMGTRSDKRNGRKDDIGSYYPAYASNVAYLLSQGYHAGTEEEIAAYHVARIEKAARAERAAAEKAEAAAIAREEAAQKAAATRTQLAAEGGYATEAQVNYLARLGIDPLESARMSKRAASAAIDARKGGVGIAAICRCPSCGALGKRGAYPFSTGYGNGLCDDCG